MTDGTGSAIVVLWQPEDSPGGRHVDVNVVVGGGAATCATGFTTWPSYTSSTTTTTAP